MFSKDLCNLLEPGVNALGFELITVELTGQGNSSIVRVYIDALGGINVDDCARVSEQLSAILDVEDPIPGSFTLEVSSPGFDRPLCKASHFESVIGHKVKVQTKTQISGRSRFTGTLIAVSDTAVSLDVDGEMHKVPIDNITMARLVPDYGRSVNRLTN